MMNLELDVLIEYLPFLIPLIILQISLSVFSLVHVLKNPNYRFGNQMTWIIVVLIFQFVGPAIYFAFGRGEK